MDICLLLYHFSFCCSGQGDVILSFDGIPIANDGTVPFRLGERISFGYLVSQKYTGETAKLRVSRKGEEMDVEVRLRIPKRLVRSLTFLVADQL